MDVNAELLTDILANRLAQGDDFLSCSASKIHQHQRLLVVHAGTSQRTAFPTALVNHPTGRNLLVLVVDEVMGHGGIGSLKLFELLATDHGIHKEAACIAHHLRIGQLLTAYVDDDRTQLFGRGMVDATALQLCTDIAIVQARRKNGRELIGDVGDEIAVLPLLLETALAIAVLAVAIGKTAQSAGLNLNGFDADYQVFNLGTIGSDILHGTGSHVARNERQVLGSVQPLLQAESHHVVPRHTATATHQLAIDLVVAHGRVYHDAREVARQQQIAAATYYNKRCRRRTQNFGHLLSLLLRLVFQEAVTTGLNAKGVVCQKAIVV